MSIAPQIRVIYGIIILYVIKLNRFEYRIYNEVYDEIASGKKTIEFRLLNKKLKVLNKAMRFNLKC